MMHIPCRSLLQASEKRFQNVQNKNSAGQQTVGFIDV